MAYKREDGVKIPIPSEAENGGGASVIVGDGFGTPVASPLPAYRGPNPHGGDSSVGDRPISWPYGPTGVG